MENDEFHRPVDSMAPVLTAKDRDRIRTGILSKYSRVAMSPRGLFQYPTGIAGLAALEYDTAFLKDIPDEVLESFCGVGNPFSLGKINPGDTVLDVGCGCGIDAMIAGSLAGIDGQVIGMDLSLDMIRKAKDNLRRTALENVSFENSSAEDLPFPDETFEVVISSGAFNLVPDKAKALKEVYRVMKPDGRLMIADQILTTPMPSDTESLIENWAR